MSAEPISIPLSNGIDTRNSPRVVTPPYLVKADNVYFDSDVGLKKRHGRHALPNAIVGGGEISNGGSITSYKNELLVCDNSYLYSYSEDAGWAKRSPLIPTKTAMRPMVVPGYDDPASGQPVNACTYALTPTLECWVYIDGRNASNLRYSVVDRNTGAYLTRDALLEVNAVYPRFVQTSRGWVLLYNHTDGPVCSLYGRQLCGNAAAPPLATGPFGPFGASGPFGPRMLISDHGVSMYGAFDAVYENGQAFVAFLQGSDGTAILAPLHPTGRIATQAESGFAIASCPGNSGGVITVVGGSGTGARISLSPDLHVTVQAYSPNNPPIFYTKPVTPGVNWTWGDANVFNINTANISGAPFGSIGGVTWSPNAISLATISDAAGFHYFMSALAPSGGVHTVHWLASSTPQMYWYQELAAKPFINGPDKFVWLINHPPVATTQPTIFVYDVDKGATVAAFAYGVASRQNSGWGGAALPLPDTTPVGNGVFRAPLLQELQFEFEAPGGPIYTTFGVFNFELSFLSAYELGTAQLGDSQVFAGGIVSSYDGAEVVEHGFLLYPELISISATSGGGTFQYCAIWQWTDACGQIFQSAPSRVTSVPSGTGTATLVYGTLFLSSKTNVTLRIFRTTSNGTIFQEVTNIGTPLIVDPTVPTISFTDSIPDSVLQSRQILYTVGGELQNDPPPSSQTIFPTKDRLLVAGGDDNDVVTYTKEYVKGIGPAFSLAFQRRISILPGPITALAAMDDYIIVFKNPGIFYWSGTGPSPAGTNDDFTNTEMLTPELGCISHRSIVYTQDGIYFQSAKGIYLLTRGLEIVPVGLAAQGYNTQSIVSAVMMPADLHMRFGCLEDITLIYHYRMVQPYGAAGISAGQWTTFSNYTQVGACLWNGSYAVLRADGSVWVEDDGYEDPTGPYSMTIQTAWLKTGQPLQAGKFRQLAILGEYEGPHVLNVDIAYDYRRVPFCSLQFNAANGCAVSEWGDDPMWGQSTWGGDNDDVYSPSGPLPQQITALGAIQLTIYDTGIAGKSFDNSAVLEYITLTGEPDDRLLRPPQKKQVG